jgi:O-antigen/teichoic acid export membrane protein
MKPPPPSPVGDAEPLTAAIEPPDDPELRRLSGRYLSASATYQLAGRVAGLALGVFVAAVLARDLGPGPFGQLALVLTFVTVVTAVSDFGIGQVAVREVAARPHDRDRITGALLISRLLLTVPAVLVAGAVLLAVLPDRESRLMAVFALLVPPLGALMATQAAVQARLRMDLTTTAVLVQNAAWLAAVVVLGRNSATLPLYGAAFLASTILQAALLLWLTRGLVSIRLAGARALLRRLWRAGWSIGLAGLAVTTYYKLDSVFVFVYAGEAANAYYAAAYRVIDVSQFIPMTVAGFFLPLYSQRLKEPDASRQRLISASLLLTAAGLLPIVAGGLVLAPEIVALVYGAEFGPAAELLRILLPTLLFIGPAYTLVGVMIGHDAGRAYASIAVAAATLNVALNLWLVPRNGAVAAAWIALATELGVCTAIALVARRRTALRIPVGGIARCAGGAALAAAAMAGLSAAPLLARVAAGGAVYVAFVYLSRALATDELAMLASRVRGVRA